MGAKSSYDWGANFRLDFLGGAGKRFDFSDLVAFFPKFMICMNLKQRPARAGRARQPSVADMHQLTNL